MKTALAVTVLLVVFTFCRNAGADVAGDVQAGLPMAQVIANGLADHIPMDSIVTDAINAGADPVAVVSAAVTADPGSAAVIVTAAIGMRPARSLAIVRAALGVPGVNAGPVITAAVTANRPAADDIARAALGAGVSQDLVTIAVNAGTEPGAGAGGFPTAGYGAPTGFVGIGGTGGMGSYGGGGGQASPFK